MGGALGQQGFPEQAGVAGRILGAHPALIPEQHIHPLPGQVIGPQAPVGGPWCLPARQGDLGAVPLRQGQVDARGHLLRGLTGQILGRRGDAEVVLGHGSHSVWKEPDWSMRS